MRDKRHHKQSDEIVEDSLPVKRHSRLVPFLLLIIFFLGLLLFLCLRNDSLFHQPIFKAFFTRKSQPKAIIQSKKALPQNVQSAIENLAQQQIRQDEAAANLPANITESTSKAASSSVQTFVETIQNIVTTDPVEKAKITLKKIDSQIAEVGTLLENDRSDKAVAKAVEIIKNIGEQTTKVATDKNLIGNREILTLLIEQYNRMQLKIQILEETLPGKEYLAIEDVRQKYLVSTAVESINAAPNLEAVHNIGKKEVAKIVGDDYTELKAIEIISDFESKIKPEARTKLTSLEKELAVEFEKRMLKLPKETRAKKLQDYMKFSFGNPILQIKSFNRMKNFMSDREMILGTDGLKEIALKKLEERIFELKTQTELNHFLETVLTSPADLKVLTEMKMDVDTGVDKEKKLRLSKMQESVGGRISKFFAEENLAHLNEYFQSESSSSADLLDVLLIKNISDIIDRSDTSDEAKKAIKNIKTKKLESFIADISKKDFITKSSQSYNPVSARADVRVLLNSPQAILILQALKNDLPLKDRTKIDLALKAQISLLREHLLLPIDDPEIFNEHADFISKNPEVAKIIQTNEGKNLLTIISQKEKVAHTLIQKEEQKLYEKIQQIVQEIFVREDKVVSEEEKKLPEEIQSEIEKLKAELPDNNIPKIETPEGVELPEIAKLPADVEQAIIETAKNEIEEKAQSAQTKLDLTVQAEDLGIAEPKILPDSPLYEVKEVIRDIALVIKLDPLDRAEELLKQDNEKTLEAAKLVEEGSQKAIDEALDTLEEIQKDFDKLEEHAADLQKLEEKSPEKVDALVDTIIDNGLARQTVLSAIEDKVYGEDYVAVEKVRQDLLSDGVDTLLKLTDNKVEELTQKLEKAVEENEGSDLKEIKAVELLTEIARTQPEEVKTILEKSEEVLAEKLEDKLLAMPHEEMVEKVLDYTESAPGNPVRQFEAYDSLKEYFDDPETKLLSEALKDKAVENLEEKISEITDATVREEFVESVVGDKPEDLKIVIEIAIRVDQPETNVSLPSTPIEEKIDEIKAIVEENIIEEYKDKPEELAKTEFIKDLTSGESAVYVDVIDVEVAKELTEIFERTPDVNPEVVKVVKEAEEKIVDNFIEEVSSQTKISADTAINILVPVPEVIAELVDLKENATAAEKIKIDAAISVQVDLLEEHLTTQVTDPTTFETYVEQIKNDPEVAAVVEKVGGTEFIQAIEQKTQEVAVEAAKQETELQTTVAQVQQEVFSTESSAPSTVEQKLPEEIQQKVEEIKQEIPVAQIPAVVVESVPATPAPVESAPAPAAPAPEAPKPAESAPAPAPVEVKPPEPAPQEAAPAAPVAPAL